MADQILLNNVSADEESEAYESNGAIAIVNVRADSYGGGTVILSLATKNDGATPRFVDLTDGSFTADSTKVFAAFPRKTLVKARLSGSTSPSNVFVDILQ